MPSNRLLAIDLGQSKTGIAITDPTGLIASPLCIYKHKNQGSIRDLADFVVDLVKEKQVKKIIIGNPVDENGNENEASKKVNSLIVRLENRMEIEIDKFSEYNSTKKANQFLAQNYSKNTRRKMEDDAIAAAVILNDYMQYSK